MNATFIETQAHAWEEIREWAQEAEAQPLIPVQPGGSWDGPGSSVEGTKRLVSVLPALLRQIGVTSMLDMACGDWNWMRLVDLGRIEYTGWDVDPGRIERCRERLNTADFASLDRPNAQFEQVNVLTVDPVLLGGWDLVLARDFFAHLPNDYVLEIVQKLRAQESIYLLASTYPNATNDFVYDPSQYAWDGYMEHPVNLETEPFLLRKVDAIPEEYGPGGVLTEYHELGLFELGPP